MSSDINVVPYIDVMLVLLVIFMVTAPLITPGLIQLPSVGAASDAESTASEVQISEDGKIARRMQPGATMQKADINVVPYIDVMLVLLVIFMVTAPLITPGLIQLPSVGAASDVPVKPLEVQISEDGKIALRMRARRDDAGHRPARAGGAGAFAHHRGNPGGHRRRWQGALRDGREGHGRAASPAWACWWTSPPAATSPLPRRNANATLSRRLAGMQRP